MRADEHSGPRDHRSRHDPPIRPIHPIRRNDQGRHSRLNRPPHLLAIGFLMALTLAAVAIWIAVQSLRDEPLPSLVWAPKLAPDAIFALGPPVLEQLPWGWWWMETTPLERDKLRALGAHLAVAMPTPVARMAGCSGDTPVNPEAAPPRI